MCPGGAASDEDEPAISEAVADPCSSRCQKIIADGELHGNPQAHGWKGHQSRSIVFETGPGRPTFDPHYPSRPKLIVAADLTTADKPGGAEVTRASDLVVA